MRNVLLSSSTALVVSSFASVSALAFNLVACGGPPMPPPPAVPPLAPDTAPSASASAVTTAGAATPSPSAASSSSTNAAAPAYRAIALPGGPPVSMDFIVFEPGAKRLWVPAGNTGRVDVIDTESGKLTEIGGFKTIEVEWNGKKRMVGPSVAALGDGVVYVGNRGDKKVCAVDPASLKVGGCVTFVHSPDCVQYVKATKELWITTPQDKSIQIVDVSKPAAPKLKSSIKFEGQPEGTSVDDANGVFYTNLEDKDRTLAIDLKSHKTLATWKPECGEAGPRGLVVEPKRWLFVACTDHVVTMDLAHDAKIVGSLPTGAGVDIVEWVPSRKMLYVGAGKAATLTFVRVDDAGALSAAATVATSAGARNAVADDKGRAYLIDSQGGRILVVDPPM